MSLSHVLWIIVSFAAIARQADILRIKRIAEDVMSLCACNGVTNNHALGRPAWFGGRLGVWLGRWRHRAELARWSDRDLHDVGLSWSEVIREAEKPFWRA